MLEERLQEFSIKKRPDSGDSLAVLQLLQEQTTQILSLRNQSNSVFDVSSSSGRRPSSVGPGCSGRSAGRPAKDIRRKAEVQGTGEEVGERERRRRRGASPKRALFGYDSCGAPNVNSLEEFPPMTPSATTSKRKEKKSSKPRRITLTTVDKSPTNQSLSSPAQFTTQPVLPSHGWSSSSPTFTCPVASATLSSSSSLLSEERRLLKSERSKRQPRARNVEKMGVLTERRDVTPRGNSFISSPRHKSLHLSSKNTSGDEISTGLSGSAVTDIISSPATSRHSLLPINIALVTNKGSLDTLTHHYSTLINDGLVPNITSEINFVVQLLTCTQPVSHHHSIKGESESIFHTVENSVYFAVQVLNKIRHFLTALDSATLQLLAQNTRINQVDVGLTNFLSEALENAQTEIHASDGHQRQTLLEKHLITLTVPFQEETDNIKNFPNMQVFHAFKKQRDSFYSILREWEANHNQPNWNYQSALKEKIRALIQQPDELWSVDHLASLFQKQLTESCGYSSHVSAVVSDLANSSLATLNPGKLMKLSKRFQMKSSVGSGSSPLPSFSDSEQFFSTFISIADSHTFNSHLAAALSHELVKLHCCCETLTTKDVSETLYALKVLAKFLGYLDFLPYSHSVSLSLQHGRTASPHVETVSKCLREAVKKNHLQLTVPWAVDYLSMMDSHALQVSQYLSLLHQLVSIYRSCVAEKEVTVDLFLVLTSVGWLLETPNIPSSFFFEYINKKTLLPSNHVVQSELVSRDLLYICCPYLSSIRVTLAEFASGLQSKTSPIRKIKPIPADPHNSTTHSSPRSRLQMRLQENFFRNHPPVLRQLCDTVSVRVSETAIHLVQSDVIPNQVRKGLQSLARWIGQICLDQSNDESTINLEHLFHKTETVRKVTRVSEEVCSAVTQESTQFCRKHCEMNVRMAISSLLSSTISEQVLSVAVGLSTDWAMERCIKWINSKLRGVVYEEVSGGFEKLRKAVRTGVRASQSHSDTSLQHLSPLTNAAASPNTSSHSISHSHSITPSSLEKSSSCHVSISSDNLGHCTMNIEPQGTPETSGLTKQLSSAQESYSIVSSTQTLQVTSDQLCFPETKTKIPPLTTTTSFSTMRSTTLTAKETHTNDTEDTDTSATAEFMEIATSCLSDKERPLTKDSVGAIGGIIGRVRDFLVSETMVVEGGHSPHLLPNDIDNLLSTSVHLAALLVSWDVLDHSTLTQFTSLWTFLKGLKKEVPIYLLMSGDSFNHYLHHINEGIKGVWSSLTSLLTEVIDLNIAAVDVVEALWLCRIRQSAADAVRQAVIDGSIIFISTWYNLDEKGNQSGSSADHGTYRKFCFVRLLALVVRESDSPCIDYLRTYPSLSLLSL